MSYLALYRKYRPKNFSEVVGQDIVINILKNSIINNKIGHAYIFSGTKGTGKTSVAKIFAKAINCLSPFEGDLCNKCSVCSMLNENNIDIIEIDAASNNGVEEIREIRNNVKIMPNFCKYKVYIIDEVHMLSTSAFNALLKTLEEPPAHIVFILATTELNKIPPTVLSRCQKLDFKKITKDCIIKQLKYILKSENKQLDDDVLSVISDFSDGAFRDAINLMDQLLTLNKEVITIDDVYNVMGVISNDIVIEFINNVINCRVKDGLSVINNLFDKGVNFFNVSQKIEYFITDIIIYNTTDNYFDNKYSKILDDFVFEDLNNLFELSTLINELSNSLKKSINQKSLFETYFIRMCLLFKKKVHKDDNLENQKVTDTDRVDKCGNVVDDSSIVKNVRINNALSLANKKNKIDFIAKFKEIENYYSNLRYNSIIKLLIDSVPEVVSEKNVIFVMKNSFEVILFDKNILLIEKLLKDVYSKSFSVVAIDVNTWKTIKEKYINDLKNGIMYTYIDEKISSVNKNTETALEKDAESLFGETVISE